MRLNTSRKSKRWRSISSSKINKSYPWTLASHHSNKKMLSRLICLRNKLLIWRNNWGSVELTQSKREESKMKSIKKCLLISKNSIIWRFSSFRSNIRQNMSQLWQSIDNKSKEYRKSTNNWCSYKRSSFQLSKAPNKIKPAMLTYVWAI